MRTRVKKWGNSLAIRIPKKLAIETSLGEDSTVELTTESGKLVIRPLLPRPVTLDELLQEVTDENLHGDQWNVLAAGREAW